jgi:choline dehydrogenase-like flavoprotein
MIRDFESPQVPVPEHSDICILGAGAAGILLATELARAGLRVALLEGGGLRQEQRSQDIYQSELTGLPHHGIHGGRFRTFGGTTTQWGGQVLELNSFDFEPRPHVEGSGWPFPKQELDAFYERALVFEGLRRVERNDAAVWSALGLDPIDLGPDFSMLYSRWCPERNFARLHEKALNSTRGLEVYTHANAVSFELNDARNSIVAVNIRSFGGRRARVTASKFVVCLGGIESTRLLLQELGEEAAPWQTNGLLGKHYQDHIGINGIAITGIRPQPAFRYFGYANSKGFRYHNKIHLKESLQRELGTLNVACTIGPVHKENRSRDQALLALRRIVREREMPSVAEALATSLHVPGIAAQILSQRYRGDAPAWKKTAIVLHCEQSPLSPSTISLSDERDELGLRRTRLQWQVSDQELHTLRTFTRVAAATFERIGFAHIEAPAGFYEDDGLVRAMCGDSNHHMGGTRMSTSPSEGIVDSNLRLHGIANGFVCSASVFPSSGFSNPTHTMLALAMRLADKLAAELPKASTRSFTIESSSLHGASTMRTVVLPGSSKAVPQLGFGCAYLLGPGLDRAVSRNLLDAAYDAGIRHFDVARLYGLGKTEALLRDFLKQHPDATVTTKFGVTPPNLAQRVIGIAQRRIPRLPRRFAAYKRDAKAVFNAREAQESLDLSLRLLGRDHVEIYLLHEARVHDLVHDDLLAFLQQQQKAGKIGGFGIGGEYAAIPALYRQVRDYAPILQFECSIFGPQIEVPGSYRIHYRTFAGPAKALQKLFQRDPELARRWSDFIDAELEEQLVLSRLLLKASLDLYPGNLTLFSSRREENIFDNAQVAANDRLSAPAQRLLQIVQQEQTGIAETLYGLPPYPSPPS